MFVNVPASMIEYYVALVYSEVARSEEVQVSA